MSLGDLHLAAPLQLIQLAQLARPLRHPIATEILAIGLTVEARTDLSEAVRFLEKIRDPQESLPHMFSARSARSACLLLTIPAFDALLGNGKMHSIPQDPSHGIAERQVPRALNLLASKGV